MMTRILHVTAGGLVWLMFAAAGGALMYANGLQADSGLLGLFYFEDRRLEALGLGGIMILLVLLYLVTIVPRRPAVRYLPIDSAGGGVSISSGAVRDFIRKIGEEFESITHLEPRLRVDKKFLAIDLDVKIQAGSGIPELSQMLQERVRESIREGLGITEIREIRVRVQEISGTPPPPRRRF